MSFGRYRELALLGHGGMARVVLAALPGAAGVQKLLVIKEMLPELARDPEYIGLFTDEARVATRLDHPNLIQTYEFNEHDGHYFFAMEYLEGQPYSAFVAKLGAARDQETAWELRWAFEELRVSIFAPELTTPVSVSLAKVAAAVTALR